MQLQKHLKGATLLTCTSPHAETLLESRTIHPSCRIELDQTSVLFIVRSGKRSTCGTSKVLLFLMNPTRRRFEFPFGQSWKHFHASSLNFLQQENKVWLQIVSFEQTKAVAKNRTRFGYLFVKFDWKSCLLEKQIEAWVFGIRETVWWLNEINWWAEESSSMRHFGSPVD